ncbi:MAG: sugar phosphate isomerase/epimerase [Firmicutes bacterium]|nr:sugar phosphate isomerase/epimerase [Bacillota bacterium]
MSSGQPAFYIQHCAGIIQCGENALGPFDVQMEVLDRALSEQVRFTFDAAHAAFSSIDPLEFLRFSSYIVNVHAYDANLQLPLGDWLPCGLGNMDWPGIIAGLKKIGYQGPVTIELNERQLRKVLEVLDTATGEILNLKDLALEDHFALYAREYLDNMIQG